MPNIAKVLREEITRISRHEAKGLLRLVKRLRKTADDFKGFL